MNEWDGGQVRFDAGHTNLPTLHRFIKIKLLCVLYIKLTYTLKTSGKI